MSTPSETLVVSLETGRGSSVNGSQSMMNVCSIGKMANLHIVPSVWDL